MRSKKVMKKTQLISEKSIHFYLKSIIESLFESQFNTYEKRCVFTLLFIIEAPLQPFYQLFYCRTDSLPASVSSAQDCCAIECMRPIHSFECLTLGLLRSDQICLSPSVKQ